MGLTIHYRLATSLTAPEHVRAVVETLRQQALDLPFAEVGEILELAGAAADDNQGEPDEHRWFKIQAGRFVEIGGRHVRVAPTHIIGFSTWPGEGCEQANFGLCTYPAQIAADEARDRPQSVPTSLHGWSWSSFCKTQYASDPQRGGVKHFLQCHLSVVKLLDFAAQMDMLTVEVRDESGYWEQRDLQRLAGEVGQWNELVAGLAGMLKDQAGSLGTTIQAPITGFPSFEHLEARGRQRLDELHDRLREMEG